MVEDSIREAIRIGEETGVGVQIAHVKVGGRENWGKMDRVLRLIDDARTRGVDVTGDVYPYHAGSTKMDNLLPAWVHDGGLEKLLERIGDRATRRRIVEECLVDGERWLTVSAGSLGFDEIRIATCRQRELEGLTLAALARQTGKTPAEAMLDLLREERATVGMVSFSQNLENVAKVLRHPAIMIGSDSIGLSEGTGPKHGMPAARLGLSDRGLVRAGYAADLVVFDPLTVTDEATFDDPHRYPTGIPYVLVNGDVVVDAGRFRAVGDGRVLTPR